MGHDANQPAESVSARFSRASALWRAFILGGWMWIPLGLGLGLRLRYSPGVPLSSDGWHLERNWWIVVLFVGFGVVMPFYHLSKLFRREPRLVLDEEGLRGPIVPGGFVKWSSIRKISMKSVQRSGIESATWTLDLEDGTTAKVRGLATLDVPYSDLFECAAGKLRTGLLQPPPRRFWSRLWA